MLRGLRGDGGAGDHTRLLWKGQLAVECRAAIPSAEDGWAEVLVDRRNGPMVKLDQRGASILNVCTVLAIIF